MMPMPSRLPAKLHRRLNIVLRMASASMQLLVMPGAHAAGERSAVMDVHQFGAIGDGVHDDRPAIQAAIDAAAKATGPETVHLARGTYLLQGGRAPGNGSIIVANAHGLTIAGEAGTILKSTDPTRTLFQIVDSSDIGIEDLRLERERPVFSQVVVRSIDTAANQVVVALEPGYAPLDSQFVDQAKFLLVFSDPASGTWGDHSVACAWYARDKPEVCWPPTITGRRQLPSGEWQLDLNTAPLPDYVGARAAVWGGPFKGHAFSANRTRNLHVENVDYLPLGTDGLFVLGANTGDFTFRNVSLDVPPGSGQLIAAIGGTMVFNNHINLTLDGVRIARVWDDAINMGANFARVVAQTSPRNLDVDGSRADIRVGDTLAIWDWVLKKERLRALVVKVTCGDSQPLTCHLQLDRDVTIGHTGYKPVQSKGNDKDGIDRVISMESAGSLHVMRSSFQSFHAHDLLLRASHTSIESSDFHDTIMAGILIGPDFFWDEGPAVADVVIKDNVFDNISGSNILVQSGYTSNLRIIDNKFIGYGRFHHGIEGASNSPVMIKNANSVVINQNQFSSFNKKSGDPVTIMSSTSVSLRENQTNKKE